MEWKEYNLEDISKLLTSGGDASKYEITDVPTKEYCIPVYANALDKDGLYGYTNKAVVLEKAVTIAARGAGTGNVCYRNKPYVPIVRLISIVPKDLIADAHYLYYYFKTLNFKGDGSAIPQLTIPQIKKERILLPSFLYQKKISSILSSLDAKIENNNKINANLEAQAAALFKSWFVDFEPFIDGEFVESELGMIPKGWKVGTLGEIAKISKMSINPAKSPDCLYSHYSLPAFDNGKLPQKQLGSEIKSNKFTFQPFSILLSKLNPDIKRIWFVDTLEENPICSTEFIPVLPNLSRDFAFTYLCFSNEHYYAKLLSGVTGATNSHQRLKPEDVINLQIPINESVFEMFAKTVTSLLIQINANIYQNKSVAQIRDTLLPKLMSGEIDLENISI